MQQNKEFYNRQDFFQAEESFDFKGFILKLLSRWHLLAASLSACIIVAFLYNDLSRPVYLVQASLLINDQVNMNTESFIGIKLYSNEKKIQNEIAILSSFSLTKRTLEKLNFFVSYYDITEKPVRELYKESPFYIEFDKFHTQPTNVKFEITPVNDSIFIIQAKGENVLLYNYINDKTTGIVKKFEFFDTIRANQLVEDSLLKFQFVVAGYNYDDKNKNKYAFNFNTLSGLIAKYRVLKIDYKQESSILTLKIEDFNRNKAIKYLNTLINTYLERETEKKNQIAIKTINFIDNQLNEILDSLSISEDELQNFRSASKIMNFDMQTQQVYASMNTLQNEKAKLLVNTKYYEYLGEYLKENNHVNDLVAPSAIGINDPLLNRLIVDLTTSYSEKSELLANSKKSNPYLSSIENQIQSLKQNLSENIKNIIAATRINSTEIDIQLDNIMGQFNELPYTQRELFGFERKFKLNDAIYTFLLQKRSEAQIAKASNLPVNEILDEALPVGESPVRPNKKLNYVYALLIGLFLPVALILLKDFFNTKVINLKDVERITEYPVLGNIVHNQEKSNAVVADFPLSNISESFRSIRTGFQFLTRKEQNVVLITSSVKGEGKTFFSLNIASAFALYEKKTVLLTFDLRNPKTYILIDEVNKPGLSNFLAGNLSLNDIIIPTSVKNLDVIRAGDIPPNPTELISGRRNDELFELLKKQYDMIIVDTPPIGAVSDFLLFIKYSDINIFVVRQDYTPISVLTHILENMKNREINLNLVFNDIKPLSPYNRYYYGYGYGYGYNTTEKKTIWQRLKIFG